jgi:hypothetical protein
MIMWIILGYLAASMIASFVFYAACVAAAHADHTQQRLKKDKGRFGEVAAKRSATGTPQLVLRA